MVEWIVPLTDAVVTVLLLVIGGNLGSFLNVVVHRLPRGESVVHGGSHCPTCGAAIRWHDNVPVFGWLLLRGRCRDCGVPIAARYPLLEAAGAVFIGGVAAIELLSGGGTIPGTSLRGGRAGADNLLLRPDALLISMAMLHAWLLFNLLLGAAVDADGQTLPGRWKRVSLLVSAAAAAAYPPLLPVGVWSGVPAWVATGPARGLVVALVGLGCGWALGRGASGALQSGFMLVGATLGWQAVVATGLLVPLCAGVRRGVGSLFPPEPPPDVGERVDAGGSVAVDEDGIDRSVRAPLDPPASRLLATIAPFFCSGGIQGSDLVPATALVLVGWRWGAGVLAAVGG